MRGCITLLTFIFMLTFPFVVLGYSLAAFIAMAIIFGALWLLTKVFEALRQNNEEEEDDTKHEGSVRE